MNADLFESDRVADSVDADRAARDFIVALDLVGERDGDELHRALTKHIGYGSADARLASFCRRIQKHLKQ